MELSAAASTARYVGISQYETDRRERMQHLIARWRRRNVGRLDPVPAGVSLSIHASTASDATATRRVLSDSLNILEQGEHVASASVGFFFRPVRGLLSPEGRSLLDLYLEDEHYHGRLYHSLRRALGLRWRLILNPLISANLFSLKTYVMAPLLSRRPAEEYLRRVFLLVLLSEYLAEPLLGRFGRWMADAVEDPRTREVLRAHTDLVDREEHYHKAWVMLYRDFVVDDLATDVIVDHLKFFLIFATPYRTSGPDMTEYVRREYAPYFVRILRTKLRLPLDDHDERAVIEGAVRIREEYVETARRSGHLAGYWRATRALAAYRPRFAATIERCAEAARAR
jgi:hypothetical protein